MSFKILSVFDYLLLLMVIVICNIRIRGHDYKTKLVAKTGKDYFVGIFASDTPTLF